MKSPCFAALLALSCLSGCSTPGATYARAHPELSPAHRQILKEGKVPGGGAVEGMTQEQVRLAIGNPSTFEKINGEDAWIYPHERLLEIGTRTDFTATAEEKMTIFFRGDRAAYAQITDR